MRTNFLLSSFSLLFLLPPPPPPPPPSPLLLLPLLISRSCFQLYYEQSHCEETISPTAFAKINVIAAFFPTLLRTISQQEDKDGN